MVKLRDVIIKRLEDIGNKEIPLLVAEDRNWGVCFQIDEYLYDLTGEQSTTFEDWIQGNIVYESWFEEQDPYYSWTDKSSFCKEGGRYELCLKLSSYIKARPHIFNEEINIRDDY
mgnify:CR=1 FL=1